jgi:hypothetical protein
VSSRVLGGVLILVGLVWVAQGLGFVGGGFMSGDRFWAIVGVVAAALGAAIVWTTRRSRPSKS